MMFAAFDQDGNSTRMGSCPDDAFELQGRDGEIIIMWSFEMGNPSDYTLVDGVLFPKGETILRGNA